MSREVQLDLEIETLQGRLQQLLREKTLLHMRRLTLQYGSNGNSFPVVPLLEAKQLGAVVGDYVAVPLFSQNLREGVLAVGRVNTSGLHLNTTPIYSKGTDLSMEAMLKSLRPEQPGKACEGSAAFNVNDVMIWPHWRHLLFKEGENDA